MGKPPGYDPSLLSPSPDFEEASDVDSSPDYYVQASKDGSIKPEEVPTHDAQSEDAEDTQVRQASKKSDDLKRAQTGSRELFNSFRASTEEIKGDIQQLLKKQTGVSLFEMYLEHGIWQKIARHPFFENITLAVISLNAVWMAVDTDWNKAETLPEADAIFQVMEHLFCTYFSVELFVRFMAFRKKTLCFKDAWFVFDSCLVMLMVSETWLLLIVSAILDTKAKFPLGNAAVLRLLRLLRLSRLARLLRSLPELLVLVKAMLTAVKSVVYVLGLFVACTYVFAILCTQLSGSDTLIGQTYFANVPLSMYTLMIWATFTDHLADLMNDVKEESVVLFIVIVIFIGLACLTLMNMLLGVLCEVISDVAKEEKEALKRMLVSETLQATAEAIDKNGNGRVSARECLCLCESRIALKALQAAGVNPEDVIDCTPVIFFKDGAEIDLPFEEFMDEIFELRGDNPVKLRDIKFLWSHFKVHVDHLLEDVALIRARLEHIEQQAMQVLTELQRLIQNPKALAIIQGGAGATQPA
jgi:voltage-gated sodium channel